MKKAVLATAIFTALVSGSSFAATVYDSEGTTLKVGGRAEGRFNISDNNESKADGTSKFKDKSRARFNLKGKTEISDELYGFGKYEAELDSDSDLTNRYFFAGIGTNIGEFSYGKQDSAQTQLTDFTDILNTFGASASSYVSGNKSKRENNFLYSGEFDALTVKTNYVASDEEDQDSFGISGVYHINDAFSAGLGYVTQDENSSDTSDQFNVTVGYTMDALYLGALFSTGTIESKGVDNDVTAYEVAAKYKFGKTALAAVYNYQEVEDTDTVDEFAVELEHKFNGHLRMYAGYLFQQIDNEDDELQAGIRYDF
ncbi:Porin-like protein L precursor [Vibrio aerogenes CECT 7868]|uniref:Porin-like protein L n=1 Tax=Vibrio aerogenes CECT 7868 TaxID=1216006 RepID=A0A1M6BFW5_9VIBR|nr:porin [Vibrio aerogenes]SHI47373.1 Porin-like protein L precursor [Vibrio aerogenes CECT 7868]